MSLSPEEIELLQSSFAEVEKDVDGFTGRFYAHLFEAHPELKHLFKGEMSKQGRLLATMLKAAIQSASKLENVVPTVEASGRRHCGYGVQKEDYGAVGESLLFSLEASLGSSFSPEIKAVWTKVYGILAGVMISQHHD